MNVNSFNLSEQVRKYYGITGLTLIGEGSMSPVLILTFVFLDDLILKFDKDDIRNNNIHKKILTEVHQHVLKFRTEKIQKILGKINKS